MGQFKPMVKMETTEPSVELKLKKGGSVEKPMAKGGKPMGSVGPARGGMAAAAAPSMPALAARRRAMKAMGAATAAPVGPAASMMGMKKGGKAEGGEADMAQDKAMVKKAFKQHDAQEHKGGKGTKLKLKSGGMTCATGGVVNGQGGYKDGGIIMSKTDTSKVSTSKEDNSPAKTGDVKLGNAGGFATGGVMKANGGGYRKGGATKKFAEGGRVQNDGGPEQMPQGRKPMPAPVSINQLAGTYKKGGSVKKLRAEHESELAPTMKAANKDSNEKYGPQSEFMMPKGSRKAC